MVTDVRPLCAGQGRDLRPISTEEERWGVICKANRTSLSRDTPSASTSSRKSSAPRSPPSCAASSKTRARRFSPSPYHLGYARRRSAARSLRGGREIYVRIVLERVGGDREDSASSGTYTIGAAGRRGSSGGRRGAVTQAGDPARLAWRVLRAQPPPSAQQRGLMSRKMNKINKMNKTHRARAPPSCAPCSSCRTLEGLQTAPRAGAARRTRPARASPPPVHPRGSS